MISTDCCDTPVFHVLKIQGKDPAKISNAHNTARCLVSRCVDERITTFMVIKFKVYFEKVCLCPEGE